MLEYWLQLTYLDRLVVTSYVVVMSLLAIYGVHRYSLALGARRRRQDRTPARASTMTGPVPLVTVQLPIFNERFVARRLLNAVAELDWPRERLEIQVLDDSTDDTGEVLRREVERLRARGLDVAYLQRPERTGYKAGALQAGLEVARGDLIAIFDADFVPPRHFLRAIVPEFHDPAIGMVQARWGHLNRDESLLTRVQALALDGHFLIDQAARAHASRWFNFNGTAGIWRRAAIVTAGGWQFDTLTEDLDLSYRAQLAGWRFLYRDDVVAPAELPADINAFKSQQHRWAKGSAQAAVKLLPTILRADASTARKLEAVFHLTGNFAYPLLLALALLAYPALELRYRSGWTQTLWLDLPFFLLGTLSVAAFYASPLRREADNRWLELPTLMALGMGMTINNARAVIAGLVGHQSEFRRTPKVGELAIDTRPAGRYRVGPQAWVAAELLLGLYFAGLVASAIAQGLWLSVPFLGLFSAGFLGTALLSLRARRGGTLPAPRSSQASLPVT